MFTGLHRKEDANEVGCIGEVVIEKWLQEHSVDFESRLKVTSHDYLLNGSLRLEVKTKDRTVPTKINYECTLPNYNHEHQYAHYFIFVSLMRDKTFDGPNPLIISVYCKF